MKNQIEAQNKLKMIQVKTKPLSIPKPWAIQNDTIEPVLASYGKQRVRWLKFGHSFEGMITKDLGEYRPNMD